MTEEDIQPLFLCVCVLTSSFFAVDWRWICVYQMRFRSVCSAWWSADLTAGSDHLFSWTKVWDLKFCDLNYEDVHCIQIFMTAKDYIVFAYAHFFFFTSIKKMVCYKICLFRVFYIKILFSHSCCCAYFPPSF